MPRGRSEPHGPPHRPHDRNPARINSLAPLFDAGVPPGLLAAFGEQLERMGGEWLAPGAGDPSAPVHGKLGRDKLAGARVACSHAPGIAGSKMLGCLPQHLVVLLDPADIVPDTRHADRRLEWRERHCAMPCTDPSATADIEGVPTHGAQGVRSLSVLPLARG